MLSEAKHLWLSFSALPEKQSEILRSAQNDNPVSALTLQSFNELRNHL
jgi:hypothetical protein